MGLLDSQSKECQRSAWPEHKSRCRMISQAKDGNDEQLAQNKKLLSTFMTKHQPILCESAIRALDLGNKPENAERYFLAIHLSRRPGKHPPQSAFEVIRAEQTPYEIMGPEKAKIMMNERAQIDQNNRRTGMDGTFFVVLYDSVSLARSALPVGYSKETTFKEPGPWKEMLFECMNEGVVF